MKKDRENFVTYFGGNGLCFEVDAENRPKIQDIGDGQFMLYHREGITCIHKNDINDLIILLKEIKEHGYKIDE
jgi:hypothetical protein